MSGFEYFKLALSRYTDFTGRSRRSEYWFYVLFLCLAIIAVVILFSIINETLGTIVLGLVVLASALPSLAVSVRRLHDIGKSGWYYLITLIPVIGPILMLIWACTDGEPGSNKWGPNPKSEGLTTVSEHLIDERDLV